MENRENSLQEIKDYVNNQGTIVQDTNFDNVIAHHLTTPLKIKGTEWCISYIGTDAIYSINGDKLSFSELSNDDMSTILTIVS